MTSHADMLCWLEAIEELHFTMKSEINQHCDGLPWAFCTLLCVCVHKAYAAYEHLGQVLQQTPVKLFQP